MSIAGFGFKMRHSYFNARDCSSQIAETMVHAFTSLVWVCRGRGRDFNCLPSQSVIAPNSPSTSENTMESFVTLPQLQKKFERRGTEPFRGDSQCYHGRETILFKKLVWLFFGEHHGSKELSRKFQKITTTTLRTTKLTNKIMIDWFLVMLCRSDL